MSRTGFPVRRDPRLTRCSLTSRFLTGTLAASLSLAGPVWGAPARPATGVEAGAARIDAITASEAGEGKTALTITTSRKPTFTTYTLEQPARVVIDISGASVAADRVNVPFDARTYAVGAVTAVASHDEAGARTRVVLTLRQPSSYRVRASASGIVVDVLPEVAPPAPVAAAPAQPTETVEAMRRAADASTGRLQQERQELERRRVAAESAEQAARLAAEGLARQKAELEAARQAAARARQDAEAAAHTLAAESGRARAESERAARQAAEAQAAQAADAHERSAKDAQAQAERAARALEEQRREVARSRAAVEEAQRSVNQAADRLRTEIEARQAVAERAEASAAAARAQAERVAQEARLAQQRATAMVAAAQAAQDRAAVRARQASQADADEARATLAAARAESEAARRSAARAAEELARVQQEKVALEAAAERARREQAAATSQAQLNARAQAELAQQQLEAAKREAKRAEEAAAAARQERERLAAEQRAFVAAQERQQAAGAERQSEMARAAQALQAEKANLERQRRELAEAERRRREEDELARQRRAQDEVVRTSAREAQEKAAVAAAQAASTAATEAARSERARQADLERAAAAVAARQRAVDSKAAEQSTAQRRVDEMAKLVAKREADVAQTARALSERERALAEAERRQRAAVAAGASRAEQAKAARAIAAAQEERQRAQAVAAASRAELAAASRARQQEEQRRQDLMREAAAAQRRLDDAIAARTTEEQRRQQAERDRKREEAALASAQQQRQAVDAERAALERKRKAEETALAEAEHRRRAVDADRAALEQRLSELRRREQAARVPAPADVVAVDSPAPVPAAPALGRHSVTLRVPARVQRIDFIDDPVRSSVIIECDEPAAFVVERVNGRHLTLRLSHADLPRALERSLDATEYLGPVRTISSYRDPAVRGSVRVDVELAEDVPTRVRQDEAGLRLYWEFQKLGPGSSARAFEVDSTVVRPTRVALFRTHTLPVLVAQASGNPSMGAARAAAAAAANGGKKRYTGRRIDLDFKGADIHNILRLLADVGGVNIVTSDDVKGEVTIKMRDVPWDQALDVVLRAKSLGQVREGNLIRVAPLQVLEKELEQEIARQKQITDVLPTETRLIGVSYAEAKHIQDRAKDLLSPRGKISVDERTNNLIVSDVSRNLSLVEELVRNLDTQTSQVVIEARIVEARSTFTRAIGVQWGGTGFMDGTHGNPTGLVFPANVGVAGGATDGTAPVQGLVPSPQNGIAGSQSPNYAINLPAAVGTGSGGALGLTLGSIAGAFNLNLRLSALENQGQVRILSSPRVSTMDNVEASIEQGVAIPISQVSAQGVNTVFVDAKLNLTVKPHVTNEGTVILQLHVTRNEPDFVNTGARGDPTILKKEAKTVMLVRDGDTAVIGGIYQRNSGVSYKKIPFFADIPIVGFFFRNRSENDDRTEFLVFITPRIANRSRTAGLP